MAGIVIQGLSKVYGNKARALESLDLEVHEGELLVVVGPSGSGKTTLLRLVAGLERPTAGTIRLADRDLGGVPPQRRDVALVFQSLALYGHLTVEQNLAFALNAKTIGGWFRRGATGEEAKARIAETAKLLRIEHLLGRLPSELSGGEQQRVALGRAIVRRPKALLLDEPLSSLDLPLRRELRRELKELQRRLGVPTIYVTHDQAEALAMGDRIAVLDRGRLIQVGTPTEIYERPKTRFVAEFFGPQGMNLIEGELKYNGELATFVGAGLTLPIPAQCTAGVPAGPVLCGFRPEVAEYEHTDEMGWQVEGFEMNGDVTFVRVVRRGESPSDETPIIIRQPTLPHGRIPPVGSSYSLRFRVNELHWFNPTTGNRFPTPDS